MPLQPKKKSSLRSDIIAYIVNKQNDAQITNTIHNITRSVQTTGNKKAFEFQLLFGELENMLLTMNLNDATVQRSLVKLNEIRTRILPELEQTKKYDQLTKK